LLGEYNNARCGGGGGITASIMARKRARYLSQAGHCGLGQGSHVMLCLLRWHVSDSVSPSRRCWKAASRVVSD
jgi:hypothetical protein